MKPIDAKALGGRLEEISTLALSAYLGARGIHQNEDPEAVRVQTRAIRQALDEIETAVASAQERLTYCLWLIGQQYAAPWPPR